MITSITNLDSTILIVATSDTTQAELESISYYSLGEATITGRTVEVRYEGEPWPAWLVEVVLRERFDFAYPAEVTPQAVPPWLDQESWTADDRLLIRDGDHLVAEAELIAVFGEKAPGAAAMFANGSRFDRYAVARVDGWLWGVRAGAWRGSGDGLRGAGGGCRKVVRIYPIRPRTCTSDGDCFRSVIATNTPCSKERPHVNRKIFAAAAIALVAAFTLPSPAFATEGGTQIDLSRPGHPCYLVAQAPLGQAIDWAAFSTDWKLDSGNALDVSLGPASGGTAIAVCQGAQAQAAPTYAIPFTVNYKGATASFTLVHIGGSTGSLSAYLTASGAKPAEYAALGLSAPKTMAPEPTGSKEPAQTTPSSPAAQTTPSSPTLPITLALGSIAALIAASAVGIRRLAKKRGAADEN